MKRMELIFADLHKTNPPNPRHQRSINGNGAAFEQKHYTVDG